MALSAVDNPWSVSYTFEDVDKKQATAQIYFPASVDYTDVLDWATGIGSQMAALSDCALVSATVTRILTDTAAEQAGATNNAQVELKGLFVFKHAQRGTFRVSIPGLKAGIQLPGTDRLNIGNVSVAAFIDEMVNGVLLPGNSPCTYFGASLTALDKAIEVGRVRRVAD